MKTQFELYRKHFACLFKSTNSQEIQSHFPHRPFLKSIMKFLFFSFLVSFSILAIAYPVQSKPSRLRNSGLQTVPTRQSSNSSAVCGVNICFALDGSRKISASDFESQKNFVSDLFVILAADDNSTYRFAAIQYGREIRKIAPFGTDFRTFSENVFNERQMRSKRSNLNRGIEECISQLRERPEELNNIVILGNGVRTGKNGANAVRRAARFRSAGGNVFAVGVGEVDMLQLLALVGGDSEKVFRSESFLDRLRLQEIITDNLEDTCKTEE